jgi:alpha-amylase/alpha-mannosidase (GH57 family)
MNKKYICIHGHFYQPPRENPWLNKVEIQESAYPYHDWNHRINAECYVRNSASRILGEEGKIQAIMNNYAWMSFNIGPTLLAWMEIETPETYEAILEADKLSMETFSGHGAALAQAYNHLIMPLANERDQETQVIWGIEDFRSRYGREPEGMWLGETAVNTSVLEMLAKHGIKFTILSPYQAKKVRKLGTKEWHDATDAKVNTRRAYTCKLPSGNEISLFFYDGPASQAVAFEGLLNNGEGFADRLRGQFRNSDELELVNIATDGESYGHHHKLGEMALSYCLHSLEKEEDISLTIYGEFLEKFPPQYEAQIIEDTSWSCYHGVERWRSDCGCNTGGNNDWNQKWREPLRQAFDDIREKLIVLYEEQMEPYTSDPWGVRNKYIQVILNREQSNVKNFLTENFGNELSEEDEVNLLKLLEMQYHAMLMYTSCGWFFDEVTGIESMQDIFYATRAIQLAEEISGDKYEPEFIETLKDIPSNIPEYGNAYRAYELHVKPMELDMIRIGAHYAISSVFEEFPEEVTLYNFSATSKMSHYYEAGKQKLIIARTEFRSDITWEKVDISYAVLYMGDHHIFGGVRQYIGSEALEELHTRMSSFFEKGNMYEIFNLMDTYFGNHNYSFWHLFRDEQHLIMKQVMENNLTGAEGAMQQLYDNTYPLLKTFQEINMRVPTRLKLPVEMAVNNRLVKELKRKDCNFKRLVKQIKSAVAIEANLDLVTLDYLVDRKLTEKMLILEKDPTNLLLLNEINSMVRMIDETPVNPEKWQAQNIAFGIKSDHYEEILQKSENGDEAAADWVEAFHELEESVNLIVE